MAMTLVQQVAEFASSVDYDRLPPEVVASIKLRTLDTLGVSLAAWAQDPGRAVLRLVRETGGSTEAAPFGAADRFPAEQAAFVSGTLAHALDFDDTHLPSILHPSATVVPMALTIGQQQATPGRHVIAAAAAGYEICIRLGLAAYDPELRNSVFFEKGLHAVPICGALAAAAVAAKLSDGSAEEIGHAMGIAASMAAGLLEANRTGGTVKQLHGGWACHAGIWAAKLARAGFTGPPTVLEGRFGFFHALCDGRYNHEAVTAGLGSEWETPSIFYKPYPANHFTHAGIDAALSIKDEIGHNDLETVEAISLGVPTPVLRTIAEPREAKLRPETGYAARFSGPFTVATAFLGGGGLGVYLDDFTDAWAHDPERRALAAKVDCYADAACDAVYPYHFPAVLRLCWRGGRTIERSIMVNRGSTARPLTDDELRHKFVLNATLVLPAERAESLLQYCMDLEELPNLSELVSAWRVDDSGKEDPIR